MKTAFSTPLNDLYAVNEFLIPEDRPAFLVCIRIRKTIMTEIITCVVLSIAIILFFRGTEPLKESIYHRNDKGRK
jgi:hypothetical protein